jgi:hypothetical protein
MEAEDSVPATEQSGKQRTDSFRAIEQSRRHRTFPAPALTGTPFPLPQPQQGSRRADQSTLASPQ